MSPILIALLCVLGLIVLLIAAAAIRAVTLKAKPNTNSPAINPTDEEALDYAEKLSEMIKVPTISLRGNSDLSQFYKLHEVMKQNFPHVFEKLECTEIEGNLILRWPGKDPKRNGLLLTGHQDVVTADEPTWERDPFSGEIADGNIHGSSNLPRFIIPRYHCQFSHHTAGSINTSSDSIKFADSISHICTGLSFNPHPEHNTRTVNIPWVISTAEITAASELIRNTARRHSAPLRITIPGSSSI